MPAALNFIFYIICLGLVSFNERNNFNAVLKTQSLKVLKYIQNNILILTLEK